MFIIQLRYFLCQMHFRFTIIITENILCEDFIIKIILDAPKNI